LNRSVLLVLPLLALAQIARAHDIRQTNYTFHFDGAQAKERETFVIDDGIPSIFPLAGAKKNPPLSVRMTGEVPAPTAPVKAPEAPAAQVQTPKDVVHTVLFGLNSAALTREEEKKLSAFIGTALRESKTRRVTVNGYTCDLGSAALNERLAQRRAETVASFLTARGIVPATVTGSGKCCYVTNDRMLRRLNRRVHITLTGEPS
jgi:outer membrane protein OmpA-like peptidoglycan-associated protein